MKSVLISIKPKYCELIANGQKTVEIRKNRPKIDAPFKCYIYCTKDNNLKNTDNNLWLMKSGYNWIGNGKVIGEFVCDDIDEYQSEFYKGDTVFQAIYKYADEDKDVLEAVATNDGYDTGILKNSALEFEDIKKYIGLGDKTFYAWRISDLVIYDTPKDIGEFLKYNRSDDDCYYSDLGLAKPNNCKDCMRCVLTRPPQSWCYVEEMEAVK